MTGLLAGLVIGFVAGFGVACVMWRRRHPEPPTAGLQAFLASMRGERS